MFSICTLTGLRSLQLLLLWSSLSLYHLPVNDNISTILGLQLCSLYGLHWQQWTAELNGTSVPAQQAPLASLETTMGWCSPQDQVFKMQIGIFNTKHRTLVHRHIWTYKSINKQKCQTFSSPTCVCLTHALLKTLWQSSLQVTIYVKYTPSIYMCTRRLTLKFFNLTVTLPG